MDSHSCASHNFGGNTADPLGILHRIAQPLSTVRGILELTLAETMSADEKKAWLEQAMEQLLRATSGFDQLRHIVEAEQSASLPGKVRSAQHV